MSREIPCLRAASERRRYHLLDGRGSTVRLIDSGGLITDLYAYKAFGDPLLTAGTTENPFRWVGSLGYYYDLDLLEYYLRARTYDPALARFLSQDPLGFQAADFNLFRYVSNCPVNLSDPSGMLLPIILGGAAAAAAAWATICYWVSTRAAEQTFTDDKQKHCMGACVFNRCTGLIVPGLTLAGSVAWEVLGGWVSPDSKEDIVADAWGIVQSYNVFSSCEDSCKDCKAATHGNRI